jgi:energy-coupling factor transporter ATP-binding protein EcfA2
MNIMLDGIEILTHYRHEIADYTKKIRHWIKHGKERVVVLGAGGVGKTTLGQILSGEILSPGEEYKESINTESFSYRGRVYGSLLVGPGQRRRREHHWPKLREQISQGKVSGVIFVTAAGFNSLRQVEPEEHELFVNGMSIESFMKKYVAENMQNDYQIVRDELAQCLSDVPGRIWFITLVLKKDLWLKNERKTIRTYQEGPYGRLIAEIAKKRGRKEFVHEYLFASLLLENLVSRKGLVLARTAAGFDAAQQLESVRDLSRAIGELVLDKQI